MTTVNNNTITITSPVTGTVELDLEFDVLTIIDMDGMSHNLPICNWHTVHVVDGAVVLRGQVLGATDLDCDGELDEGLVLAENATHMTGVLLSQQLGLTWQATMTGTYTIQVGEYQVRAEYGEICRVTLPGGATQLLCSSQEAREFCLQLTAQ